MPSDDESTVFVEGNAYGSDVDGTLDLVYYGMDFSTITGQPAISHGTLRSFLGNNFKSGSSWGGTDHLYAIKGAVQNKSNTNCYAGYFDGAVRMTDRVYVQGTTQMTGSVNIADELIIRGGSEESVFSHNSSGQLILSQSSDIFGVSASIRIADDKGLRLGGTAGGASGQGFLYLDSGGTERYFMMLPE